MRPMIGHEWNKQWFYNIMRLAHGVEFNLNSFPKIKLRPDVLTNNICFYVNTGNTILGKCYKTIF